MTEDEAPLEMLTPDAWVEHAHTKSVKKGLRLF
jgi:hypothetical protein